MKTIRIIEDCDAKRSGLSLSRGLGGAAPIVIVVATVIACGSSTPSTPDAGSPPYGAHSSAMAITKDGAKLFVANADTDSVSVIDLGTHSLSTEILLGGAHPAPDANGAYTPAIMPRDVALSADEKTLYVSGQRAGKVFAIDVASSAVTSVAVCSEPVGLVVSQSGDAVFVACSQDSSVVRVSTTSMMVTATATVPNEPWALAFDGGALFVTHFLGAAVTAIDPNAMTLLKTTTIPDVAPRGDKRLAHGQPRGLYDVALRPGTTDVWIAHSLLGTDTAQPDLDFESTTFASISIVTSDGVYGQTLSIDAADVPNVNGAFGDIVSGPHALAFTNDGAYALMVDSNSEDVLVVDCNSRVETSLLRPLGGHQPEAVVISPDEKSAYIYERNTNDVVVAALDRSSGVLVATVSATGKIPTLTADPMPTTLRFGQHLFNSANSDEYPLTTNHWVACATCHMEGRSDAVTWRFAQGPRDTPTNAGGMIGTGFLFRTADRNKVQDYWRTINIEQGGHFDPNDPNESALLDAIAAYVNLAIPIPVPPTTDATLVSKGQGVFMQAGCPNCHSGSRFTDSGQGNPTLDLTMSPLLHDVGTCATTSAIFPDVDHEDIDGDPRAACMFDTPSLSGLASTPPYMHDGTSLTIDDAAKRMLAGTKHDPLSPGDQAALVEYLRSL